MRKEGSMKRSSSGRESLSWGTDVGGEAGVISLGKV